MTNKECFGLTIKNGKCTKCLYNGGKEGCVRLKSLNDDAAENLILAITNQAAKDYRLYRRMVTMFPSNKEVQRLFEKVKAFFISDYFISMTKLDGNAILEQLEKEPLITDEQLSEYGNADE